MKNIKPLHFKAADLLGEALANKKLTRQTIVVNSIVLMCSAFAVGQSHVIQLVKANKANKSNQLETALTALKGKERDCWEFAQSDVQTQAIETQETHDEYINTLTLQLLEILATKKEPSEASQAKKINTVNDALAAVLRSLGEYDSKQLAKLQSAIESLAAAKPAAPVSVKALATA